MEKYISPTPYNKGPGESIFSSTHWEYLTCQAPMILRLASGCYSDEKGDKSNRRRCNSERRRCKSDVGEDKSYRGGV